MSYKLIIKQAKALKLSTLTGFCFYTLLGCVIDMITAEKTVKDLDNYYGKAVILKYLLNDEYEIEVQMPLNWKEDELPDILAKTFVEEPKKIHILSIDTDKRLLN